MGLVVLHVAAIAYYRVARKTDLVRPMLLGDKDEAIRVVDIHLPQLLVIAKVPIRGSVRLRSGRRVMERTQLLNAHALTF